MHLRRLRIDSLPGIEPGFAFKAPSEGLIVVTGPNAVGKSSLVRALGYLLRGSLRDDPPALSLFAEFSSAGTVWTVRRSGSQVVWTRDGETVTPPVLPGADQIGLYLLSVESLLAGGRTDTELAAVLQRSLRGGFDLDEPRTSAKPRVGRNAGKAIRDARKALADVENKYEYLRREEAELPALARQIKAAELAGKKRNRLEAALQLYEAATERKARQRKLAAFPEVLRSLKGDEIGRADGLSTRAAKLEKDVQSEQGALDAAVDDHRQTGLAESRPAAEEVESIDRCLQRMSLDRAKREARRGELAKAERTVQQAISEFGGSGRMPRLDRDSLGRCEKIAGPLVAAHAKRKELEQRIEICGDPPEESEVERLQRGVGALRSWLADSIHPGDVSSAANGGLRFAMWASLAAGLIAAGLSYLRDAFAVMAAAVAAAIASGTALLLIFGYARSVPAAGEAARREFEETGLAPPPSWTTGDVREHLRGEIERRLNAILVQRERAAGVNQLRMELKKTADQISDLETKLKTLGEEVGFDPTLPLTALDRFLRFCLQLDEARGHRDACRTDLDLIDRKIASTGVRVGEFLDRWRIQDKSSQIENGPSSDGDLLQTTFDALRKRLNEADAAIDRIRASEGRIQSLRGQIDDANADLKSLYDGAGLHQGDRTSLQQLVGQLDDWRDADRKLEQARGHENRLRAELLQDPELIEFVEQDEKGELESRFEAAKSGAAKYTDLRDKRKAIETKLDEAGSESQLERALATLGREQETLAEQLDQTLQHAATEVLLDDVEAAFKSHREPMVLRRAGELFAEATAHEFALILDENEFKARDVRTGTLNPLKQLSSGTRMQLLLAVRLAWTEAQEQGGERLPLFLDEALTTSDENRFGVVANSLQKLAEAGDRQIFYLTARRHEAALWLELTGRRPSIVDLAEVRFGDQSLTVEDYRIELPRALRAPEGMSAEDYATLLRVPPLNPHLPAGTAHLFHLLRDDLDLLHRLMDRWHVSSVGQLEHLLRSSAAPTAVGDAGVLTRMKRRCQTLRGWLDLWRQGRGRPVDRGALEQSGAVSAAFIDRATNLADELGGDGQALIEALRNRRLARFKTGKIDELEHWLQTGGFTDERSKLPARDRKRIALLNVAPETEADARDVNEVVAWLEAAS